MKCPWPAADSLAPHGSSAWSQGTHLGQSLSVPWTLVWRVCSQPAKARLWVCPFIHAGPLEQFCVHTDRFQAL